MNSDLVLVDYRCDPECQKFSDYRATGFCPSVCGSGGYCCRQDEDWSSRCSLEMRQYYEFPTSGRHFCFSKPSESSKVFQISQNHYSYVSTVYSTFFEHFFFIRFFQQKMSAFDFFTKMLVLDFSSENFSIEFFRRRKSNKSFS